MAQPPHSSPNDVITWRDHMRLQLHDVGFLRHLWRNFGLVAPGVYRSNHPGPHRLRGYGRMGVRAILNLRGTPDRAPQRIEARVCAELGIEHHIIHLSARQPPRPEALMALFAAFDTLPRPLLIHCKSGADRAGLASALYLLDQTGADIDTAKRALSMRYLHIKKSETGILDHVLDLYANRLATGPIPVRDWVATEYDRTAAAQSYSALTGKAPRL